MAINTDAPGFASNGGLFACQPGERGIEETDFVG
jgi:hypothetical protein